MSRLTHASQAGTWRDDLATFTKDAWCMKLRNIVRKKFSGKNYEYYKIMIILYWTALICFSFPGLPKRWTHQPLYEKWTHIPIMLNSWTLMYKTKPVKWTCCIGRKIYVPIGPMSIILWYKMHGLKSWLSCKHSREFYSAFKIAIDFKVKSLYFPLHTVIRPQLRGAPLSYSYGIIAGRWGRERDNKLLRQISASGTSSSLITWLSWEELCSKQWEVDSGEIWPLICP